MEKQNTQDLLKQIENLKSEIKKLKSQKSYGLVWEDKPEQVVLDCQSKIPVLKEVKNKEIITDKNKPVNILIEGDNYHALSVLNYTHKGKVDVIYIDPPYNRGGDFKYNDKYVEKDDAYKHSKWLSSLNKRLRLAKNLLRDEGVMFVSIDDSEQAQLRLLLNEVFGEDDVDIMVWRKSGYGRDGKMKNTTTFRKDHEYVMVCYKYEKKLNKINEVPEFQNEYGNPDNDPRGSYKAGSISRREDASNPDHVNFYTVISPSGKKFSRQFDIPKDDFNDFNDDILTTSNGKKVGRIYWGANDDAVPAIKIFINEVRSITPYSVLLTKGTTTEGTKEVSEILNKDCKEMRPKPTMLIKTLIQLADKNSNLTVLDFFAGTGTTGHAVLKLNKMDGGKRQFILCTNNENEIAEEVCYPRIKNIIRGYKDGSGKKIEGLSGNFKYFKTDFVDVQKISNILDENKIKLTYQVGEMIALRENTLNECEKNNWWQIYTNGKKHTAIYFAEDKSKLQKLVEKLSKFEGKIVLYIFSWGKNEYGNEFSEYPNIVVEDIPEPIIEVYKEINKL